MFDHRHAQRAWCIGLSTQLVDQRGQVNVIVSFEFPKGNANAFQLQCITLYTNEYAHGDTLVHALGY
jgi:hypothetical protein